MNGVTLTPGAGRAPEGRAKFSSFAPFVGIGWDNTFHSDSRWAFKARLGAIFGKTPDVSLRAVDGVAAGNPLVDSYLRQQEAEAREELDKLKTWPVAQIGVSYRF